MPVVARKQDEKTANDSSQAGGKRDLTKRRRDSPEQQDRTSHKDNAGDFIFKKNRLHEFVAWEPFPKGNQNPEDQRVSSNKPKQRSMIWIEAIWPVSKHLNDQTND